MSSTYTVLLFTIVTTEIFILMIYHHNASARLQQLRYRYGLEAIKLKKRIESLKQSIQRYHDKIDTVRLDIEDFKVEQQS